MIVKVTGCQDIPLEFPLTKEFSMPTKAVLLFIKNMNADGVLVSSLHKTSIRSMNSFYFGNKLVCSF